MQVLSQNWEEASNEAVPRGPCVRVRAFHVEKQYKIYDGANPSLSRESIRDNFFKPTCSEVLLLFTITKRKIMTNKWPKSETVAAAPDPAEARKRRKEIMQSQRSENEGAASNNAAATADNAATAPAAGATGEKKPPKKRKVDAKKGDDGQSKKKTQIRYDPDVPMNKEQLAAWRREARRVRNRESAAASRQRIRNRISELEDEVGQWKTKYAQAMERLQAIEQSIADDAAAAEAPKN